MEPDQPPPPSTWAARQRQFRTRFAEGRDGLPVTDVFWRGVAPGRSTTKTRLSPFLAVVGLLRRGNLSERPLIALWVEDVEPGTPAMLIFEVAALPALAGGHGVVVGELDLNGSLCLVLDDGTVVWPTYNPRQPAFNAPRR